MEFRILGPLQVIDDAGRFIDFGPRQARVLATMLMAANTAVSVPELISAAWDDPPATARRQIQNCVWLLRKQVNVKADGRGYLLRVPDGALDAQRFHDLTALAEKDAAEGRHEDAVRRLTDALRLWRGPAASDCVGETVRACAARLDEQRLAAHEQRIELELALGKQHTLIPELIELAASNPLRERLIGQLMTVLHLCGRQADAIAAYQRLRTRLSEELGLDPSPSLQATYTAILRNELRVEVVHRTRPVPRQLPTGNPLFVGRAVELQRLRQWAESGDIITESGVVCVLSGMAGAGKTALALHWADRAAEAFPGGQLYLNLHGYDPAHAPMPPPEAARRLLEALSYPDSRIPAEPEARASMLRGLLRGSRMLLVLDNVRDAEQVLPLLPGPGCFVLCVSRTELTRLVALHGAHPVEVGPLSQREAWELLARRLGYPRVQAEPEAVEQIIGACGRLPLALSIVAARAAARQGFTLTAFAARLREPGRRLDELSALADGDPFIDVRAALSWSYETLSPAAAHMLRRLSATPGPIDSGTAARLLAVPITQARACLAELARARLVEERSPDRFGLHDLVRLFAAEQ